MRARVATYCTLAALLWLTPRAGAHALLRDSDPAAGAMVSRSPSSITLDFTEEPEPRLSMIRVLDAAGRQIKTGLFRPVPAHPTSLTVSLNDLPTGVYTTTWRVVSQVDGHTTGGTFAFGIGTMPTVTQPQVAPPTPSPFSVAARWVWYVGLFGLVGCTWAWTIAFRQLPPNGIRVLWLAWLVSAAGLVALARAQAADAGVGLMQLIGTSLGRALAWRAVPIIASGGALALASRRPSQMRRLLAVAGISAALAILAHVAAGHAGASQSSWRWVKIAIQWAHVTAAGAWIGGLAAVLVALRDAPAEEKAAASRRFSTGAGIGLGVVVGTGILRAVDELQAWEALMATRFGQLLLAKAGLLLAMAALGALNRYRSIPAIPKTLPMIRRVGATELVLAGVVLAATGMLTGFPPPGLAREAEGTAARLVVTGSDFATSVQVRLEVSPGVPGINRFVARLADYDTRRPVEADRLTLRFAFEGGGAVPASVLPLTRQAAGTYAAQGTNVSLEGHWRITAVVERGIDSVEVPLSLTARSRPQPVETIVAPGQPTLYVVDLPGKGSLQVYLDPEQPGQSELHATFFDAAGQELPVENDVTIAASRQDELAVPHPARRFGPGHFIGDVQLVRGTWQVEVSASGPGGEILRARLTIQI